MELYKWYRVERWLYLRKIPIVPQLIKGAIRVLWGGVIPYQCEIGEGTSLAYQACGTVIHKRAKIGRYCHIAQNVTIGGTSGIEEVPVIGDRVFIGAGASIIGPVVIGNDVTIGAGAVVVKDIPSNCVVAGVPARIIKHDAESYAGITNR